MTKEDVIRMAREAGFRTGSIDCADGNGAMPFIESIGASCNVELERFAALVAAAEREACAKVCEKEAVQIVVDGPEERAYNNAVSDCAAAIRARGQE